MSSTEDETDSARWLALEMLRRAQHELDRADEKANTLFRLYGVVIAASVGVAAGSGHLHLSRPAVALMGFAGIAALAATVVLGWSILPRLRSGADAGRLTYFGDVVAAGSVENLHRGIAREAEDVIGWVVEQLATVSRIVDHRYRLVRLALSLMGVAMVLAVVAIIANSS